MDKHVIEGKRYDEFIESNMERNRKKLALPCGLKAFKC